MNCIFVPCNYHRRYKLSFEREFLTVELQRKLKIMLRHVRTAAGTNSQMSVYALIKATYYDT